MDNQISNKYFPLDVNRILITTQRGGWAVLSDKEYDLFQLGNLNSNSELFAVLQKAGIIGVIQEKKTENKFLSSPTAYHVIAVTDRCNFNCIYCHPDANPQKDEMTEETAKKVLDFIFSIPMVGGCQIVIEGGEPLLKWDLIKLILTEAKKRAGQKNLALRFSFTTNLSLMTDEIAREMAALRINPCVSLDGPKELHDQQRPLIGGQGSYDKTIYWIDRLKKEYGIKAYAILVITNLSLKYGPEAIIDEYLKIGQDTIFFKPFRLGGRASMNLDKLAMEPADFYNFWQRGVEYCLALNKKGIKIKELNTAYFMGNVLTPFRQSMCHRRPCGAGINILSYKPDGTINACDAARVTKDLDLGHVGDNDYETVRQRAVSLSNSLIDKITDCHNCPFTAYCQQCLADEIGQRTISSDKFFKNFLCQWQKMVFPYLFKKLSENEKDAKILKGWSETNENNNQ